MPGGEFYPVPAGALQGDSKLGVESAKDLLRVVLWVAGRQRTRRILQAALQQQGGDGFTYFG